MRTPPDDDKPYSTAGKVPKFEDLRGLLKGVLASLGGGEAFLRRERERFYDRDEPKEK